MIRRCLLALGAAVTVLLAVASPASAHATMEQATPLPGSQLAAGPAEVNLRFSETVGFNQRSIVVMDAAGGRVDAGDLHSVDPSGHSISVRLRSGLAKGSYTVVWRVVSADSHPVAGTFSFGVEVPAGATLTDAATDPVVPVLHGVGRGVALTSVVVLVGGLGFVVLLWPAGLRSSGVRRLLQGSWWAGVVATGWLLAWQGPYGAGLGVADVTQWSLLSETTASTYGKLLLLRLVVLASVGVLLRRLVAGESPRELRWQLAGLAVVAVASFSAAEHSGTGGYQPWAVIGDGLHLAAASLWLGGLAVLLVALAPSTGAGGLVAALPRWSRLAATCVVVLVVTGTLQAWREIGSWGALTDTEYGKLVATKTVFLAGLLLLGATSNVLVRRIEQAPSPPPGTATSRLLRQRVGAEAVLGVAVIVATAVLVNAVPGKEAYSPPFSVTLTGRDTQGESATLLLEVTSTKQGLTDVHLYSYTPQGQVLTFGTATATMSEPSKGLGPVKLQFTTIVPGHAVAQQVVLPAPGNWQLNLQVVAADGVTDYSATTRLTVT